MTRHYLVQDYCGGMMIRYAGKYRHKASERRHAYIEGGWPAAAFVIVQAASRAEAWELAEPRLHKQLGRDEPKPCQVKHSSTDG